MTIYPLLTTIDGSSRIKFAGIQDQQFIAFTELDLDNVQSHVATLYSVFVDPAHRHQGYARILVTAALEAAHGHGKRAVNLRVHKANKAALSLYDRLGFDRYEGPDAEGFVGLVRWV